MKSIFRIYAKTSKGNDNFLYNQLLNMGLKPKYEDLLHSFYFNANFNDIFKLSFESFTVENLYVQLGHRYPLSTSRSTAITQNEQLFLEYLRKINFRNYLPLQKNLIQNITLKLFMRQSSSNLPSQNAITSIFQNYLQKQIIMKQYKQMLNSQETHDRLENYYDIKQIVEKKWQHEEAKKQELLQLLQSGEKNRRQIKQLTSRKENSSNQISKIQQGQNLSDIINLEESLPYQPHFILYIRRNHARMLLKLNKQSMHKFGWKKNVGWGPIRETLTSSILYQTGLFEQAKNEGKIKLWDPFCGSGTIPLVALSMLKQLRIRKEIEQNFIWQKWPIYNPKYLEEYLAKFKQNNRQIEVQIFGSDIDISATRNSVNNFKELIATNSQAFSSQSINSTKFLNYKPSDQIFQLLPNSIYIGCGDFEVMAQKIFTNPAQKINIVTNLPYLGERSKQHYPLNQLHSIYRRFDKMIEKYGEYINNVFVVIDSQLSNKNHFIKVCKEQWRVLQNFNNGGIQVSLLGWSKNKSGWKTTQITPSIRDEVVAYDKEKTQNLEEYRKGIQAINKKKYQLPAYLNKSKGLRGVRRVLEKKKARHLRATYEIFARRRDRNALFQSYSRKNLALRLSRRGKTWKNKNMSLVGQNILNKQAVIKKQFESRVQQALKRSQQLKSRKKGRQEKVKPKW